MSEKTGKGPSPVSRLPLVPPWWDGGRGVTPRGKPINYFMSYRKITIKPLERAMMEEDKEDCMKLIGCLLWRRSLKLW